MSTISPAATAVNSLTGSGASSSSGQLTVAGLATGLDTNSIITGLLAIDQQRITELQGKSTTVQTKETVYKAIESRLLTLQSSESQLAKAQNGVFDTQTVSSNNTDLVTAAADSTAQPGIYQVRINSLAQANQIVSQGYDSASSLITQGTFQIKAGSGPTATITINSGNNTLQGLANAINGASAGVVASVIQDGSGSQSFRLLLSSTKTGASNSIAVTNSLAADGSGQTLPVFSASYVGAAATSANYTGTSVPASNQGTGHFTGAGNNAYTFTVVNGGTVGGDDNLQIAYTDASGAHAGTLTVNSGDAGHAIDVAEGVQVSFSAGTMVAGQSFTVKGYVPVVQQGTDAAVTIGSGSGALTINSASNQLDDLFPGVSLNLLAADPTKTVTLTVAPDVNKAKQAIEDFVNSYNDLMTFIDDQVSYDSSTSSAGILLGDFQVNTIQDQVRNSLGIPVPGLNAQMNRLSALGITTDDQGHLAVDDTKLTNALSGNISGVSFNDIRKLFALTGASTTQGIEFVTASSDTKATGTTPYQVTVTHAATQASITAGTDLADETILDANNNTLSISIDGSAATTITLAPGTYTRAALAQEIAAEINNNATLTGRNVTVGLSGNKLTIASSTFGNRSAVSVSAGSANTPLGLAGTETDQGDDVQGYFTVNGQQETATGNGQFLIGAAANKNTADLQVRVSLSADQVGDGVSSDITVTRGVASSLDGVLQNLTDPVSGRLKTIDNGFVASLQDIQDEITRQTALMTQRHDSLVEQFSNLESIVSKLQSVSNMLNSQIGVTNAFANSNKKSSS